MTDLSPIKDLQTYMDGLGENAKGAASALRLASEEQKALQAAWRRLLPCPNRWALKTNAGHGQTD